MFKLSFIIPVYGVENYLAGCLDSLYSQIDDSCQVVLVDDESPDSCGIICEDYKSRYPRVTTVIHQKNMGLGGARNTGIENALGEYLFFLDSDDTLPDGTVSALLAAIDSFGADIYAFPYRRVGEDGGEIDVVRDSAPVNTPLTLKDHPEILCGTPNACNKVFSASLFRESGVTFPSRVWYEDIRTVPKLYAVATNIVFLDRVMYNYLQREGSIMNNAKVERNVEIIEALDDLLSWFQNAGLYAEFCHELDYLIIDHVFVSATVRVLRSAGAGHHLIGELRDFTYGRCTTLSHNKYLSAMPKNRKLIFKLLSAKLYFAVQLIFKIKG